ncbi:MAG TPA: InlB B-repeat-containing protein, partial [Spirochaetota bacterium]|nr:InlB B-repeat-containing protein [Spirochaetota bacterium]
SDGGVIATRTDTNITGDLTVTASFAIDQYTVSFDSQGGSAVDPQLVNYGGLAIEPTAPSRTGYAFLGWHKESACTTPWAFAGDIVTGATTLYAKWGTAGELDTSLDPGTGANDNIHSIAIQSDQKIIIGGEFTDFDGTSIIRLARLNANGSLDTTFNPGSGPYIMWQTFSYVYAIAIQSDGKIMIGGGFSHYNGTPVNHIARVNIDGSLDTTFNQGSGCTGYVKALAIQSDGKILIGGSFSSYNGTSREKIVRVNADGSIDTTFDPGSGAQDWPVNSIAIQSDGKIMIAGQFSYFNGTVRERMARLNANGSLDMSFTPGFNANNTANSVAIQGDGKILVGGWFSNYNGSWSHSGRLNADGSIDTAFATNAGYGTSGNVYSIVLQADGKILAGGIFTAYNLISRNRIARVNTDGTLDTTFVPGSGADAAINAIAIQSNGYIVIGGAFTSYNGTARNRIARIIP